MNTEYSQGSRDPCFSKQTHWELVLTLHLRHQSPDLGFYSPVKKNLEESAILFHQKRPLRSSYSLRPLPHKRKSIWAP